MVAITVSRWASSIRVAKTRSGEARSKVGILASNNMLVDQYLKDYPSLQTLHAGHRYFCQGTTLTIKDRKAKKQGLCHPKFNCKGCTAYKNDSTRVWSAPYALLNYHMYVALKFFKHFDTIVVDEAHNLIPLLQDMGATKIWNHTLEPWCQYSESMSSVEELRGWLSRIPEDLYENDDGTEWRPLRKFREAAYSNKYIFKAGLEEYRGEERHCIKLIPIDLTEEPRMFFPDKMQKIILMSATISPKDVEQMGLYHKKVTYIAAPSPIDVERRPVYLVTPGLNMSYNYQQQNLPALAQMLRDLLEKYPEDKGLVHAPYSLAGKLRALLSKDPRFLFHTKENKMDVYKKFRESQEPLVLVASGMYEGIDLPYEASRFQAITKVPYPSLADPAIEFKSRRDKDWFSWETAKVILQACGRVVRSPTDWGHTYVLDNSFRRLLQYSPETYWPQWYQDALEEIPYE